jgi:hypothetical protein
VVVVVVVVVVFATKGEGDPVPGSAQEVLRALKVHVRHAGHAAVRSAQPAAVHAATQVSPITTQAGQKWPLSLEVVVAVDAVLPCTASCSDGIRH